MRRVPTLIGISGHFTREVYPLGYGKSVVVGRSREADFSLRRTEKYRTTSQEQREKDEEALTVSGRHFQITVYNLSSIEIKNLSPNGTYVDGKLIETVVLDDISKRSHVIKFGRNQALKLEMRLAAEENIEAANTTSPERKDELSLN
jgi:pSer/pThr/pTyr-binding forkhead associated (FHA) protein